MLKKILFIFGTRPEAIKVAPLIIALRDKSLKKDFEVGVCITAQHREMLDQVLDIFNIKVDFDLNIMQDAQDLYDISSRSLLGLRDVLKKFKPNLVFVHGDTSTTFIASLASFYQKIDIAHLEAGLRTFNIYSPYPEEMNRVLTSKLAKYHFTPTKSSFNNLIKEGVKKENILITGNTVIDALFLSLEKINKDKKLESKLIKNLNLNFDINKKRFILVTGHRRENFGEGFLNIANSLKEIAISNKDIDIVFPVHLNPNVQKPVKKILSNISNIHLISPLRYEEFIYLMSKSYFIITDSGGVQEEAPSLGKPILLTRDTTERPEALDLGVVKLVSSDKNLIIKEANKLISDEKYFNQMSKFLNPYGDGKACLRIIKFLKKENFG